jgi:hypothetical protein
VLSAISFFFFFFLAPKIEDTRICCVSSTKNDLENLKLWLLNET